MYYIIMPKTEKINMLNIFEIQKIFTILEKYPDLLELFKALLIVANHTLNSEELENIIDKDSDSEYSIDLSSDSE